MKALAGTRLGWTAEKPSERTWGVAPNVEDYRNNEAYWKLMDALAAIGKAHGERARVNNGQYSQLERVFLFIYDICVNVLISS